MAVCAHGVTKKKGDLEYINPFTLASFSPEKWRYMMKFDVEAWMDLVPTFASKIIPLTREEVDAIVTEYKVKVLKRSTLPAKRNQDLLKQLTQKVEKEAGILLKNQKEGDGIFIRTSSRSPKDVVLTLENPKLKPCFERHFDVLQTQLTSFASFPEKSITRAVLDVANIKLWSFMLAGTELLCLSTGKAGMDLIMESERVYCDFLRTLEQDEIQMAIVLREFNAKLRFSLEFRAFVCLGEITAISQYWEVLHFPHLAGKEKLIVEKIQLFSEKHLKQTVFQKYETMIVDFALLSDSILNVEDAQVIVIELNPFGPVTGPSLFSWRTDRQVLQGNHDLYRDLTGWCEKFKQNVDLPDGVSQKIIDGTVLRLRNAPHPHIDRMWSLYQEIEN